MRTLKQQNNALADEAASAKFKLVDAQQEQLKLKGQIVEVRVLHVCHLLLQIQEYCVSPLLAKCQCCVSPPLSKCQCCVSPLLAKCQCCGCLSTCKQMPNITCMPQVVFLICACLFNSDQLLARSSWHYGWSVLANAAVLVCPGA